eukprot:scaffold243741_cov33-Tisochrysis_lutea.AAC.1
MSQRAKARSSTGASLGSCCFRLTGRLSRSTTPLGRARRSACRQPSSLLTRSHSQYGITYTSPPWRYGP